jgi:hypothetical protein
MAIDQIKKLELEKLKLFGSALKIMPNSIKQLKIRKDITEIDKKINSLKSKNMAKTGFVFIKRGADVLEIPTSKVTKVNIDKLPQYDFFAYKNGREWLVYETTSGLSVGGDNKTRKEAIEYSNNRITQSVKNDGDLIINIIKKESLPKQYLDRLSQKKTPAKTIKKPVIVKDKVATKTARKATATKSIKRNTYRKMKLGDAIVYQNKTWYITIDENGATGIVNMAPGAYGSKFPNIMLSRIDVSKVRDLYGNKVSIPYTFKNRTTGASKTARKVISNRTTKSRPAAVKVKTATKTARKATATRTATKKAKSKPTEDTGVLKYSKALGNGKYEYKYVKKRK